MATRKFKCKVCGYVHEGDSAPEKCPVCQVPASEFQEITEGAAEQPKKKGIDTNSNVYTIVYASFMVIIVAFMLAFVSSALKPIQDVNVENDTKGQILTSLNIDINGLDVASVFNEKVKDMVWNGSELVPYEGKFNSTYGALIKEGILHVFVATVDEGTKYVIPVTGRGLWGGLWGYVSLNEDKQNIFGTYFYHESETAGLGARIGERFFQESFNGKPLFINGNTDQIAVTITKSGAAHAENEVNGITGATLTNKGVDAMIKDGLGAYASFITGSAASADKTCKKACGKAEKCKKAAGECKEGKCADCKECCGQECADKKCADCKKDCKKNCGECKEGKCADCKECCGQECADKKCADCKKDCKKDCGNCKEKKCADKKECPSKKNGCPKAKECKN